MLRSILLASSAILIAPAAAQNVVARRHRRSLRARRPQRRLGGNLRPNRRARRPPGKGRQGHDPPRHRVRRRVEVRGRRNDLQAGVRQAAGAVDRRSRARPHQPAGDVGRHRRKLDPQLGVGRQRRLQVRATAARPGPTSGSPGPSGSPRIVVHPKNGNIVYVCAPGPLWSDSPDRGLYKTTDGGRTWSHILKGANLSTGCSSVAMDPSNPEHLLAGTWDFRRRPDGFRSGGDGPTAPSGSRFAESRDGGRTWSYLDADNRKGLPKQPWGRLEIAYAPSNPKRVYAFVENVRPALFVSDNGGLTWEERDRSQGMVWRPFYFGRIVVDPKNPDRLFKMGYSMIVSDDGGKSFSGTTDATHGDWHDLWINPTNTKHLIGADDAGMWTSYDGGNRWFHSMNLPLSQFYHVSVDDGDPYQVYGGLQDNSSWVGDQEYPGGITNNRWENLYGGDGFWVFADPADPNFVYVEFQGGHIARVNRKTLQGRDIRPTANYKEKLRFNWNSPIHLSPNEKGTLYIGSQFLFRSRDHGATWDRISPDLSTNDPNLPAAGAVGRDHRRQFVRRDEHHHLFDLGKPARGGADLGRHRRRQPPADARRRPQLDQRHRQHGPAARQLDQLGRGQPPPSGGRLRHQRPPHARRHAALSLPDQRLRPDLAAAGRPGHARRSRLRACDQGRPGQPQHPVPRHRARPVHQRQRRRQLGPVQAQQLPRRSGGARHRHPAPRGRSGAGHPRPRHLGGRRHQPAAAADRRDPGVQRQPASRRGRSSSGSRAMAAGPRATPLSTARTRPAARRSLTIKRRAT